MGLAWWKKNIKRKTRGLVGRNSGEKLEKLKLNWVAWQMEELIADLLRIFGF